MMGVNLTSGGSLQWWVDSVLQGLTGITAKKRYDAATAEAARVTAGSDGTAETWRPDDSLVTTFELAVSVT